MASHICRQFMWDLAVSKMKSLPSQRLYLRSRNTISTFTAWWFVISTMDKNRVGFKGDCDCWHVKEMLSDKGPDGNEEYFTEVSRRR